MSFYGDGTLATRLRMPLPSLFQARDELLAYDLIAHEPPLTQVLSLLPRCQRRRSEPGGGLMQLGDILHGPSHRHLLTRKGASHESGFVG